MRGNWSLALLAGLRGKELEQLFKLNIRYILRATREEGVPYILVCVYLFFEYVRPQSIYSEIDIVPWGLIVIGLTFIAALVAGELKGNESNANNKLILVYGIVVLMSSAASEYPAISFATLRVFFDWVLIYFIIVRVVNNERRFFVFFLLFLLFSFKMSQHGFLSWANRGFAFAGWGITGAPGWFHNSGEVGIQMCIFVPLSVAFIFGLTKYISRKWLLFLALMPLTGIATAIGSSSRGALVGLGASALWFMLSRKLKQMIVWALIFTTTAALVYFAIPEESLERFRNAGSDGTSEARLERWVHGIETMNRYPILGVGFGVWPNYYSSNYQIQHESSLFVHNIFVQCGSELGYTGLLVFLLMISVCLRNTARVRKICLVSGNQFLSTLSLGMDAGLIGFLASGSFVTVLYYPYFWIHCALTTCLHSAALRSADPTFLEESGRPDDNMRLSNCRDLGPLPDFLER